MSSGALDRLRRKYHRRIFSEVLRLSGGKPNNADGGSASSVNISRRVIDEIGFVVKDGKLPGQSAGSRFEEATKDFLRDAFAMLQHLRPGNWSFSVGGQIDNYEQYRHLHDVRRVVEENKALLVAFGDYIVKPDIVVVRQPIADEEVNEGRTLLGSGRFASLTPLRSTNSNLDLLHASISCKWTIRSDRSQNARTEGLNLIRNRKGRTPHIAVVVGEPLPSRIASLALGTGDIDCVYHFALPELEAATTGTDLEMLRTLTKGKRLRDVSDLPFDLAT